MVHDHCIPQICGVFLFFKYVFGMSTCPTHGKEKWSTTALPLSWRSGCFFLAKNLGVHHGKWWIGCLETIRWLGWGNSFLVVICVNYITSNMI